MGHGRAVAPPETEMETNEFRRDCVVTMYGGMTVLRNTIRMNHDSEGQYTVTVVPGTVRVGTDGLRYANRASFPHKVATTTKTQVDNFGKTTLTFYL